MFTIFTLFLLVTFLTYTFVFLKPSNDRNWEVGFEKLPHVAIEDNKISISGFRDYRYAPGKFVSSGYINLTVDLNNLQRVWFVVEPFEQFPIPRGAIAHTYFVFDFSDQKPIVVSVEARREKGEVFNVLPGMLNQFELMYVWASEEDLTQRRVLIEGNKIYMYPLTISNDSARELFLQLARTTQDLETRPRFYNTLTSNCTNELAKNANRVKSNAVPFNIAMLFTGYSARELHKLGFIPNDMPLEKLSEKYYISDLVKKHYASEDFSKLIRLEIDN